MKVLSPSPKTTKKIAFLFGKAIKKSVFEGPLVIGLRGNLGSGKSLFAKGLAEGLGIRKKLLSPTFLIMKIYPVKGGKFHALIHIDSYRVTKASELKSIGIREVIRDKKHISLIEWADKIKSILPKKVFWINFYHGKKENERILKTSNGFRFKFIKSLEL